MPDRVLFVVDNFVLSQMTTLQMSENSFDEFQNNNVDYFRNLFFNKIKNNLKVAVEEIQELKKEAADNKYVELFGRDDIHPKVYQQILLDRFGKEWVDWDNEVIIKNIENEFRVEVVGLTPFNKIMCVKLIQVSDTPFVGFHIFEKVARAFNDKYIDFNISEFGLSLAELIFTLRIVKQISDIDVYNLMSEHVYSYIVRLIVEENHRVVYPKPKDETEKDFFRMVSGDIAKLWDGILAKEEYDTGKINTIKKFNRMIALSIVKLLDQVRGKKDVDIEVLAKEEVASVFGKADDVALHLVIRGVINNLTVDNYLAKMENKYNEQLQIYLRK